MKKLPLAIAILLISIVSHAQIKYGPKAGINFYQFRGDDVSDNAQKLKVGFWAGGLVNIPISEMFSLQPEVFFSNQGGLNKDDDLDIKAISHLNYINVPVLFQYNSSGFFAETGPEIGFLVSAKGKIKSGGNTITNDIKDDFKPINFSWDIGLGYQLENGFGLGIRYSLGITSIADNDDADVKNSGFGLHVFYKLGGK